MKTEEISIEEIKRLDDERTQGEWFAINASICAIGRKEEIARMHDQESNPDKRFITSSPRIAAKCIALDEELSEVRLELYKCRMAYADMYAANKYGICLASPDSLSNQQLRAENERLRVSLSKVNKEAERYLDMNRKKDRKRDNELAFFWITRETADALSQSTAPAKEDKTNGGWLDISSVPKDKWVLVNRVKYSGRAIAQLIDETDKGYGMTWFDDEMNVLEFVPRFWQPLPAQPTINDKQGE